MRDKRYKLTYKIDFTGAWVSQEDFNDSYKRLCRLANSFPEYIVDIDEVNRDIPPYDPDGDSVFRISLYLRDQFTLQNALNILNNYCEICYMPVDEEPEILTM